MDRFDRMDTDLDEDFEEGELQPSDAAKASFKPLDTAPADHPQPVQQPAYIPSIRGRGRGRARGRGRGAPQTFRNHVWVAPHLQAQEDAKRAAIAAARQPYKPPTKPPAKSKNQTLVFSHENGVATVVSTTTVTPSIVRKGTGQVEIDGVPFVASSNGRTLVREGLAPLPAVKIPLDASKKQRKSKRSAKKKKSIDKPCRFFVKTGRCTNGLTCPYVHDSDKVSVCQHFLRGKCTLPASSCPQSHTPNPNNAPHCLHFPSCRNGTACLYAHVHVAADAPVCRDFADLGWCDKGLECTSRHVWECPQFSATGQCTTKGCRLPHIIRRKGGVDAPTANQDATSLKRKADEDIADAGKKPRTDGTVETNDDFVTLVLTDSEAESDQDESEESDSSDSDEEEAPPPPPPNLQIDIDESDSDQDSDDVAGNLIATKPVVVVQETNDRFTRYDKVESDDEE